MNFFIASRMLRPRRFRYPTPHRACDSHSPLSLHVILAPPFLLQGRIDRLSDSRGRERGFLALFWGDTDAPRQKQSSEQAFLSLIALPYQLPSFTFRLSIVALCVPFIFHLGFLFNLWVIVPPSGLQVGCYDLSCVQSGDPASVPCRR